MPPAGESSTAYRDKHAEVDDDDDLDDLDDVLASFNNPKPSTRVDDNVPYSTEDQAEEGEGDEDFDASLVEGMESLLRQLAGDHPPGPMPGTTSEKDPKGKSQKAELSPEEEEKAFQRAIEMMLSKEGMDAMGLNDDLGLDIKPSLPKSTPKSKPKQGASTSFGAGTRNAETDTKPDISSFEETIRKAMESLNTAGTKPASGPGGDPTDPADLAKLLASLGNDPNLDLEGDDELSGILDGMMGQLMTREVLEEPMAELASKYPDYLASPPKELPAADLTKYKNQYALVQKIVDTFRKPGYSDDRDGKEIARLVGEMQDLGGPPQEIMGDLPEGFDLGALAGDESCTIM